MFLPILKKDDFLTKHSLEYVIGRPVVVITTITVACINDPSEEEQFPDLCLYKIVKVPSSCLSELPMCKEGCWQSDEDIRRWQGVTNWRLLGLSEV